MYLHVRMLCKAGRRKRANRVRTISSGERISAVNADAATATPRDASGYVESAISVNPGSGSDSTAERKDPVHDSSVRRRMLYINDEFCPIRTPPSAFLSQKVEVRKNRPFHIPHAPSLAHNAFSISPTLLSGLVV